VRAHDDGKRQDRVLSLADPSLEVGDAPDGGHVEAGQRLLQQDLQRALFDDGLYEHEQLLVHRRSRSPSPSWITRERFQQRNTHERSSSLRRIDDALVRDRRLALHTRNTSAGLAT
jgi:hypothetical protein